MPRAETIVGWFFFGLLISGFVVIIASGAKRSKGKGNDPKFLMIGLLLFAAAFFTFGLIGNFLIRISARPVIVGRIMNLKQFDRKYASSDFLLADESGDNTPIHANYNGPKLIQGEFAKVRFVQYNQELLDLTMMSGPTQGWSLHESDQTIYGYALAFFGLFCVYAAYSERRKIRSKNNQVEKKT